MATKKKPVAKAKKAAPKKKPAGKKGTCKNCKQFLVVLYYEQGRMLSGILPYFFILLQ